MIKIENKNELNIFGNTTIPKFKKLITFIESFDDFSNLKSLSFTKIKKSIYEFELQINFDKYFIKTKLIDTNMTKNPQKVKYKLYAIIGNHILINKKWLGINEYIDDYKLIEIKTNFVKLRKENNILKLQIKRNNEFTKSKN